jgi:hypothetical protein
LINSEIAEPEAEEERAASQEEMILITVYPNHYANHQLPARPPPDNAS